DRARRRRAHRVDLRATGRRPHHRHRRAVESKRRGESRFAMIRTELTAAGIEDPGLRGAYLRCRTLNAAHGRTFFLATRLLAPDQRPPVHALYGFARYADDILDDFDPTLDTAIRAARLRQLPDQFFALDEHPSNPVLAAVRHPARRYGIRDELFDDFL